MKQISTRQGLVHTKYYFVLFKYLLVFPIKLSSFGIHKNKFTGVDMEQKDVVTNPTNLSNSSNIIDLSRQFLPHNNMEKPSVDILFSLHY